MFSFINSDCIPAMKAMPVGSVNLVVTSPPYNAAKAYESDLTLHQYESFAERWIEPIPRLLADDGAFWLNVGYTKLSATETLPLTYLYYPIIKKAGLHLIQEVVWHYEGGMAYKSRFSHRTERWQWWVKNPKKYTFNLDAVRDMTLNRTNDKRNNPLGKNPTDYWYFDRVVGGTGATLDKTLHPCQFPVRMVERIITACSHPGEKILDPFGGSGSTAVASLRVGGSRTCESIEADPTYHLAAQRRFNSHFPNWLTSLTDEVASD